MVPWPYGPMASQRTRKEGLRRWPFAGRLLLDGGGDALALLDTTRRVALPTRLAELRDLEARFQGPNSPAPAATVRQMADMVEKMGPQLQKALGELCAAAGRAPPGDDPQQEERAQALREEALEEMRYSREKQAVQRLWLWHPFDGPDGLTALHVAALLDSPALVRVLVPAPDASDLFGLHAPMAAPLLTCSRRAAARPLADLFAACEDLRLVSKARVALCKGERAAAGHRRAWGAGHAGAWWC